MIQTQKPDRRSVLLRNYSASEGSCECGCGMVVENEMMLRLQAFVFILERIHGCPVKHIITSGARCASHNASVGGAKESQHLSGKAVDGTFHRFIGGQWEQLDNGAVANFARESELFGGVGFLEYHRKGKNLVHLDCREGKVTIW